MTRHRSFAHRQAVRDGWYVYNTGKPCKHGHQSDRYTASGACVTCTLDRAAVLRDRYRVRPIVKS